MEEDNWADLDAISKQKKWNQLYVHRTFGFIIPTAIVISFILFLIVLSVYVIHLIIRHDYRWLSPDELQHIHAMLFSGVVGGAIAVAARIYFLEPKDKD